MEINSVMPCLLLLQELSHHTGLHPPRSMQQVIHTVAAHGKV